MSTLLVTNDFPPRPGGIQQFVHNLALRLPPDELVVYSSDSKGSADFDAANSGLGLRLASMLGKQLGGTLTTPRLPNALLVLEFPERP